MRRLAQLCCTLSASAMMLWGCDDPSSQSLVDVDGSFASIAAGTQLAAASNVTATNVADQRIDVRWTDNADNETGFDVLRSQAGPTGAFALIATTGRNVVIHGDANLAAGAQYCYAIRAFRISGNKRTESPLSNVACIATPVGSPPIPAAPSTLSAAATSPNQIDLAWQDNSDNETSFQISRSSSGPMGTFYALASTAANATTYRDATVQQTTEYCYHVRAVNAVTTTNGTLNSYSPPSNTVCVTTPVPSVPPPSGYLVKARMIVSSEIDIIVIWTDSTARVPAYRMYRSTDGGAQWEAVTLAGSGDRYTDAVRVIERPACYRAVAYNEAGDAAPSEASCVTVPAAPTNFAATRLDATTVRFTWSDNSGVEDRYEIWAYFSRGDCCPDWASGGGDGCSAGVYEGDLPIAEVSAGATEYRHTFGTVCGILDYPNLEYWVVARNGTGMSPSTRLTMPSQSP
jgi:hypothetical protein